jgi:hypothetical protein
MRVYLSGEIIPMASVTWDVLCNFRTYVTTEDPDCALPPNVMQEANEAHLRIAKALRISHLHGNTATKNKEIRT